MFKKYRMQWAEEDEAVHTVHVVDFFVHSKGTKNGFVHRACVIGSLPRLDQKESWDVYNRNSDKEFRSRTYRVSYANRTWEAWPGQTCLSALWDKLSKLKFIDMAKISPENPFGKGEEPEHEELWEPDSLFGGFKRG